MVKHMKRYHILRKKVDTQEQNHRKYQEQRKQLKMPLTVRKCLCQGFVQGVKEKRILLSEPYNTEQEPSQRDGEKQMWLSEIFSTNQEPLQGIREMRVWLDTTLLMQQEDTQGNSGK